MTTILQVSDTHIVPAGQLVSDRLDTAASLERLVSRITAIKPAIGPVDAILLSGDLSDDGSAESYARLKTILAPLGLPLFVIPGNHDLRDPMRAAFASDGYLPQSGRLNWSARVGDIDLIGLDTLVEGQGGGVIDAATLDFLEAALRAGGERPVLLSLHHPPFTTGIGFMDRIGLEGGAELECVLSRYEKDIRIVCGHIHCTMISTIGSKVALSAPSPCSSFAFDRRADAPVGFYQQEDGFMLHHWRDGFQSVRISAEAGEGPFPF